jgi:hypothetical protein
MKEQYLETGVSGYGGHAGGDVGTRLRVEFAYYKLVNNIDLFMSICGIQRLLCLVTVEDDLVSCF